MSFLETMREILKQATVVTNQAQSDARPEYPEVSDDPPPTHARLPAPGTWIEWQSPLFPSMIGEVIEATESDILVWHPKAEDLRNISVDWVTRTLTGPEGTSP